MQAPLSRLTDSYLLELQPSASPNLQAILKLIGFEFVQGEYSFTYLNAKLCLGSLANPTFMFMFPNFLSLRSFMEKEKYRVDLKERKIILLLQLTDEADIIQAEVFMQRQSNFDEMELLKLENKLLKNRLQGKKQQFLSENMVNISDLSAKNECVILEKSMRSSKEEKAQRTEQIFSDGFDPTHKNNKNRLSQNMKNSNKFCLTDNPAQKKEQNYKYGIQQYNFRKKKNIKRRKINGKSQTRQKQISPIVSQNFDMEKMGDLYRLTFDNGDYYFGQMKNGFYNGKGKFYSAKLGSYLYTGEWIKNKANGLGQYNFQNGTRYAGHWKDDLQDGQGIEIYPNGEKYVGSFSKGQKCGQGIYYYKDGSYFEGSFKKNMSEGKGKQHSPDGSVFEGFWIKDKKQGEGTLRKSDGRVYLQTWKNNKLIQQVEISKTSQSTIKMEMEQ